MNKLLGALLCCFAFSASAQTPTTGRDYSDIWFNASESGWGVNVIQQDTILFITLFVYGPDGRPVWYVAPAVALTGSSGGVDTYSGELYATTGTPFGTVPFNPASVTVTAVGTLTFTGSSSGATLSYTVSGIPVTKSVVRQTWRTNVVPSTQYTGATSYTRSQCAISGRNGPVVDRANYTFIIGTNTFSMVEENFGEDGRPSGICRWNGTYSQTGRLGRSTGTATCEDNVAVPYTITDLQITASGFSSLFTAQEPAPELCQVSGRIAGVRR